MQGARRAIECDDTAAGAPRQFFSDRAGAAPEVENAAAIARCQRDAGVVERDGASHAACSIKEIPPISPPSTPYSVLRTTIVPRRHTRSACAAGARASAATATAPPPLAAASLRAWKNSPAT